MLFQPESSPSVARVRLRTRVSPYAHAAAVARRPPVPVIEKDERILLEGRVPPRPRGRGVKGLSAPWPKRP